MAKGKRIFKMRDPGNEDQERWPPGGYVYISSHKEERKQNGAVDFKRRKIRKTKKDAAGILKKSRNKLKL